MQTLLTKKFIIFAIALITIILIGFILIISLDSKSAIITIDEDKIYKAILSSEEKTNTKIDIQNKTSQPIENNDHLNNKKQLTKIVMEDNFDTTNNITPEIIPTKPFSFVVIADSESYKTPTKYNDELEAMLAKAKSLNPNFALFSGDLVAAPNSANLKHLKKLIEKYFTKYYIAFGKHDIECGNDCVDSWKKVFFNESYTPGKTRYLYHSFDYENTHFVLLSTDYPLKHSIDDAQLAWLNTDLAATDKKHIIVASHVPPVNFFKESAKDCHDMSCSEEQRDKLMNLLRKYKVDLVISGHEHAFDHKIVDDIDFIIAGNTGNGKRYKGTQWENIFSHITVSENNINLKAINLKDELIREIKIK